MAGREREFFTLGLPEDATVAVIEKFTGIEDDWRIDDGERMGERFPPTVTAKLDSDWGDRLTDFLGNSDRMLVLSKAARALFEQADLEPGSLEYLPFVLENRKGREMTGHHYCVAHPLRQVACMDKGASRFKALDDGKVSIVSSLQVVKERIPHDAMLFRLQELPSLVIMRSDLRDLIEAASLTGLCLTPMGEQIW
jgi:ADP-ribose pyrophosphatase YjhB (NUDIX family)